MQAKAYDSEHQGWFEHFTPDWQPVMSPRSEVMVEVPGLKSANTHLHFRAHLDHALQYGYDQEHGGLYLKGFDNQQAVDREKVWWCQAELMAALTTAIQHDGRDADRQVLDQLLQFLQDRMIDPADGIWIWSVGGGNTTTDKPMTNPTKKNHWKANYHDVRGMIMFTDAFAEQP